MAASDQPSGETRHLPKPIYIAAMLALAAIAGMLVWDRHRQLQRLEVERSEAQIRESELRAQSQSREAAIRAEADQQMAEATQQISQLRQEAATLEGSLATARDELSRREREVQDLKVTGETQAAQRKWMEELVEQIAELMDRKEFAAQTTTSARLAIVIGTPPKKWKPLHALANAASHAFVGKLLHDKGVFWLAELHLRRAEEIHQSQQRPDTQALGATLALLASVRANQGFYDEAVELQRQAMACKPSSRPPDALLGSHEMHLAQYLMASRRYKEAEPLLREKLADVRRDPKAKPDWVRNAILPLAACLQELGRLPEALVLLREAVTIGRTGNEDSWATFDSLCQLALVLRLHGELSEADEVHRALAAQANFMERVKKPYRTVVFGKYLAAMKQYEAAEKCFLDALRNDRRVSKHPFRMHEATEALVASYEEWGKPEQAAAARADLPRPDGPPDSTAVRK